MAITTKPANPPGDCLNCIELARAFNTVSVRVPFLEIHRAWKDGGLEADLMHEDRPYWRRSSVPKIGRLFGVKEFAESSLPVGPRLGASAPPSSPKPSLTFSEVIAASVAETLNANPAYLALKAHAQQRTTVPAVPTPAPPPTVAVVPDLAALIASGDYEAAWQHLTPADKSQFLGKSNFITYMKARARGADGSNSARLSFEPAPENSPAQVRALVDAGKLEEAWPLLTSRDRVQFSGSKKAFIAYMRARGRSTVRYTPRDGSRLSFES